MKIKKTISAALIFAIVFCTFITVPAYAKETPYGYSEIAEINIGITEDVFGSYRRFNPVFSGSTAVINADGWNCGYIDLTGNLIIPTEYTLQAGNFLGDYAMVDKAWLPGNNSGYMTRYGLIDRKGDTVLPLEYAYITAYNGNYFNEYGFAVAVAVVYNNYQEGFYGAVDKDNNIVIPFEYDYIEQFIDGQARASKDGKEILLDIYGNEFEINTSASDYGDYEIVSEFKADIGKYKRGVADAEGNVVLPYEYDSIWHWKDSLFITNTYDENYNIIDSRLIDAVTGRIIAESSDRIYPYDEYGEETDLLILNKGETYWYWESGSDTLTRRNSKFGAISLTTGETVIPFEYDYLGGINDEMISATKDGKIGFIDKENNILVPFVHDGIFVYGSGFVNGMAIICGENYDLSIDENNNLIYKTDLYNLSFSDGFNKYGYIIFYERDNIDVCGVMDTSGKIIIPMEYDYGIEIIADKYILCKVYVGGDFSYTIYDLKGNKISKDEYSGVFYLDKTDSFLVNDTSYAYGIIDGGANYILPMEYYLYDAFSYGYDVTNSLKDIIVMQDIKTEKYGYINSSGKITVPAIFDYACSMSGDGYAIVKQGEQWKIIRIDEGIPRNKNGDILGSVLYSDIVAYINGKAIPTNNVNGKTLVSVEDLAKYGFVVAWDNGSRTLRVQRDKNAAVNPLPAEKDVTHKTGTFKCNYLYTDIKSYLSGEMVGSYNIDGVTLIDFELLAKYGKLTWNGKLRELRLVTER